MKRETLLGVWELVSCEGRNSDGSSFLPYGPTPIGKLIYTEDGHLAVTLMSPARPPFASEDISKSTNEEKASAFNTFDSYCGRWKLDEVTGRVEHIIEAGRIPNWIGKTHTRFCSIDDQGLTLATDEFQMAGKVWQVYVKWKRPT